MQKRFYKNLVYFVPIIITASLLWLIITAFLRSDFKTPPATIMFLDRNGKFLANYVPEVPLEEQGEQSLGYWQIDNLPDRIVKTTLALEDKRFWYHAGIDPVAMARAFWQNISNRKVVSGASTLAMQIARLQNPKPRTYTNKIIESLTAVFMTIRHGRENILRQYLTIIPYGNRIFKAFLARLFADSCPLQLYGFI